jgi:hypothetical protein
MNSNDTYEEDDMPRQTLSRELLESRLLEILTKNTTKAGLTYSQLGQKCGIAWRRGLAIQMKIKAEEARTLEIKNYVYNLWERGLVFIEPPKGNLKAPRVWDLKVAGIKFPNVSKIGTLKRPDVSSLSVEALKNQYDKFARNRVGGYVPIFEVRRAMSWPRETFDDILSKLYERDKPIIELHTGDPQSFSPEEREDSLERGGTLYLRMRWRK